MNCMVLWCNNKGKIPGINYFCLTKKRHDAWMQALGRNPIAEHLSEKNVICSKHFYPEDICRGGNRNPIKIECSSKTVFAKKIYHSTRKTWQDIRSRTESKNSSYQKHKRGTGGGPYLENPNRPFDQEVLDTINTVSLEGHEQVLESATEFVLAYDGGNESAEYALDQRCDFENVSTGPIMNDVSTGPIVNDISNAKDDSQISSKNIVQSNSACTQPRHQITTDFHLRKKNDIKSKYYEKKIILLERIATAKERSAAAQEDIANKLGCLEGAIESSQDAIA
ncbi:hypothetical protein JTB14_003825 [Gonioctena quinquepunctata]|nr:hypothetical protein JTB14_003825 [Gonioctena quinquepunctata]